MFALWQIDGANVATAKSDGVPQRIPQNSDYQYVFVFIPLWNFLTH